MNIKIVEAYKLKEQISKLFLEYTTSIIKKEPDFEKYLKMQNYDDEVNHLDIKYAMPYGRIYIAYCCDAVAGCIGLRKIDKNNCEMKRLYVRQKFRNRGIGGQLVKKVIKDAKEIGYSNMVLDTFSFLENAIEMYKKYGFYEIESYNNRPLDDLVYLKLDL